MMHTISSNIDGVELAEKVLSEPSIDWYLDSTSVRMSNKQNLGISQTLKKCCSEAIEEAERLLDGRVINLMVNILPAGVVVPIHTDTVIGDLRRWHLPLVTNVSHCYFWDEIDGFQFLRPGWWHRVNYSIKHSIGNFSQKDRIHLIVDME